MAVLRLERPEPDLLERLAAAFTLAMSFASGWLGVDLVVAVGAEEEQVGVLLRVGEHRGQEVEGGDVAPLQVVDEQRQRRLRAGEAAEEAIEEVVEAVARLDRRQRRDRGLRADAAPRARG